MDGTCLTPTFVALGVGDECIDNGVSVGRCIDSYCDVLGSDLCEPLLPLGASCSWWGQCLTDACEEDVCAENTACTSP